MWRSSLHTYVSHLQLIKYVVNGIVFLLRLHFQTPQHLLLLTDTQRVLGGHEP